MGGPSRQGRISIDDWNKFGIPRVEGAWGKAKNCYVLRIYIYIVVYVGSVRSYL